ncbi:hypothetical protein [Streptomyces sp. NPDC002580]|uniref:hypothetical protein n=1 Tax=Streptomyces sp. NPDC002580 TaxID=3364653 RepID=UPI0036A23360
MKPEQDAERDPAREERAEGVVKGRVTPVPAERPRDDRATARGGAADRAKEGHEEAGEVSRRDTLKGRVEPASAEPVRGDRAGTGAPARETAGVPADERGAARDDRKGRPGAGTASREADEAAPPAVPRGADAVRGGGERRNAAGALPESGPAGAEGRAAKRAEGPSGHEDRLLPVDEYDKFALRMRHAVGGFVDGPQASVEEADHVLEELAGRVTEAVARRRSALRTSWRSGGEGTPKASDTEQLRLALRDYREMTERLLHF